MFAETSFYPTKIRGNVHISNATYSGMVGSDICITTFNGSRVSAN